MASLNPRFRVVTKHWQQGYAVEQEWSFRTLLAAEAFVRIGALHRGLDLNNVKIYDDSGCKCAIHRDD